MKNGEIRVLRDSLRVAQQEKEKQRQAHLLLEREKAHVQSEKEKELSKKVVVKLYFQYTIMSPRCHPTHYSGLIVMFTGTVLTIRVTLQRGRDE